VISPATGQAENLARAWATSTDALSLIQETGNMLPAAVMQLSLGQIALREGDYDRARATFLACVPVLRTVGWPSTVADGLVGLADVAREQGNVEEAAALYAEGLALYRQIGGHVSPAMAWVHCRLAGMYLEQGDWTGARTHANEALTIARDTGQVAASEIVDALEVHAALAAQKGSPSSLHLAGAAVALRANYGLPEAASRLSARERRVTYIPQYARLPEVLHHQTRAERGPVPAEHASSKDEQATAWTEGQYMSLEAAIAYALGDGA
jgi:tetratricopeptide (TPR) repeat protein